MHEECDSAMLPVLTDFSRKQAPNLPIEPTYCDIKINQQQHC